MIDINVYEDRLGVHVKSASKTCLVMPCEPGKVGFYIQGYDYDEGEGGPSNMWEYEQERDAAIVRAFKYVGGFK